MPVSVQILKPFDLGEYLPFGDLLAGQVAFLTMAAADAAFVSGIPAHAAR